VSTLGLRGVFLESEQDGRLLDAPEARPVLTAAAELGAPVFTHPINPKGLTEQLSRYGQVGTLFARGAVNAAALIALVDLRVVFTNLAIRGLLHLRSFGRRGDDSHDDIGVVLRRHVYIDTMEFDPVLIRAAADTVGVDHVLAGSDWPIVSDEPISHRLAASLTAAGFDAAERQKIAGANTRTLLGL